MAYSILTERYDAHGARMYDYLCDTAADLPQPSECIAGSTAYVADEKKKYIVNCCAEWCEQPAEGGGNSGGGELDAYIDGSLTELTSEVETVRTNAFYYNKSLTRISLPNVLEIPSNCFAECSGLESVSLPKVNAIQSIGFNNCSSLKSVFVPLLTYIGGTLFYYCSALETIDLPLLSSPINGICMQCKNVKNVMIPNIQSLANGFSYCNSLEKIDLNKCNRLSYSFSYCYSLKAVILRGESVCTLVKSNEFTMCYHFGGTVNATYNPEGLKDGYIYVPAALVDNYKAATNWSTFADQFRALEDYTVDGTITGELDETKI